MNLIDNWEGYYEYGIGYSLPQFGERVNIQVNFQGNNDNFVGTVKEVSSEHSVPLEATIIGFTDNELISFIKTYPKVARQKEFGSSEIKMENGQIGIEHQGYIDPKFDAIYGSWSITETAPADQGAYPITVYGTWLLRRVK